MLFFYVTKLHFREVFKIMVLVEAKNERSKGKGMREMCKRREENERDV